jgi:hypothetical protein
MYAKKLQQAEQDNALHLQQLQSGAVGVGSNDHDASTHTY